MGTFIVATILIAIVGVVIYSMVKDKKNGKSGCGCGCSSCANSPYCHKH